MLRKLIDLLAGRRPAELSDALARHQRAVDRSVAESEHAAAIVRDVTLNTRSAIEAVNHSWDMR
ncbi:hypothetical protein [Ancylobacter defluvii]|uniref:Uncharacterized protein n=1 Tax=Ancylobacter defluvii TaxID=1282440 RepID=A0A9W6K0T8_9HYPH|nr:hypothetical protein [Ancylobacter defluvii]MBS7588305.1 hypothetical protein [Ancylobacter defluvii]GLK86702.1 hypothetical protein GCM10017653_47720 [Ancylobacter defluvii]